MMIALGHWAARRGARYGYLQVASANSEAITAYQRLGFSRHHRYRYLKPRLILAPRARSLPTSRGEGRAADRRNGERTTLLRLRGATRQQLAPAGRQDQTQRTRSVGA